MNCMATIGDHHTGEEEVPCKELGTFLLPFIYTQLDNVFVCGQHFRAVVRRCPTCCKPDSDTDCTAYR